MVIAIIAIILLGLSILLVNVSKKQHFPNKEIVAGLSSFVGGLICTAIFIVNNGGLR